MPGRRTYPWCAILLVAVMPNQAQAGSGDAVCDPARIDTVISNSPLCPGDNPQFSVIASGQVIGYSWEGPGTGTYFSLEPAFSFGGQALGEYTIIAYGMCGNDTARVTVTAQGAGAGQDQNVHLCDYAPPLDLASLLGPHDLDGSWTCNGVAHPGWYVPGIDLPGDYVYTVAHPATCPGSTQQATVHVDEIVVGNGHDISTCESDMAFGLALGLDPDVTSGGQWFRQVFLSLVPHNGIYDPPIDSSGTFMYEVQGCFVTLSVDEAPLLSWFEDADGDGFGDPGSMRRECGQPAGFVADSTDTCPLLYGRAGDPCDDGLADTVGDTITDECICEGALVTSARSPSPPRPNPGMWPNPNPGTLLHLTLPGPEPVDILILDALGRIQLEFAGRAGPGDISLELNGRLAPGAHRVRLSWGGQQATKLLLIQ